MESTNQFTAGDININNLTTLMNQVNINNIFRMKRDCCNVVKSILGERNGVSEKEYLVEWLDKSPSTWELASNMSNYTLKNYRIIEAHNSKITNPSNKKAFIYTRTSYKNDVSVDTQKTNCLNFCLGCDLQTGLYAEDSGVSGRYNNARFHKTMNNLNYELGFWLPHLDSTNVMVVYSIDRIGRHTASVLKILEELTRRRIDVCFVKENIMWNADTPSHIKAMVQQQVIQAEQFSNLTSEKVKNTYSRLKNEGHYLGRVPYGYKVKRRRADGIKKLVKFQDEQNIINKIKNLYRQFSAHTIQDRHGRLRFLTKSEIIKDVSDDMNIQHHLYHGKEFKPNNITYLMQMQDRECEEDVNMVEIQRPPPFNPHQFVETATSSNIQQPQTYFGSMMTGIRNIWS